jgi:predicted secreted protein
MAGFSTDGRHFLYLESSRDTGAGIPKSRLQVVNVAANACQPEACIATRYGESDANLPTQTAEESLLKQTWQVRQTLQLTPPVSGAELSIVARSRQPNGTELVTVRLKDGDSLQLQLQQKRIASIHHGGTAVRDRAAMQLQVSRGGQSRLIGSLNDFRDDVLDYSIRGVKLSPDGKRVAILLTATTPTFEGTLATTLVQGAEL